jgi:hypothetical protein
MALARGKTQQEATHKKETRRIIDQSQAGSVPLTPPIHSYFSLSIELVFCPSAYLLPFLLFLLTSRFLPRAPFPRLRLSAEPC